MNKVRISYLWDIDITININLHPSPNEQAFLLTKPIV